MKRGTKIALAAGLVAVVAAGGIVYAQVPGRGMGMMAAMGPMGPARMCERGPAMLSGWLAYAESRLKLNDEQRPAWTAFTTDLRGAADNLVKVCPELSQAHTGDVTAELARHERLLTAALDAIKVARPALDKLNAALTPEQRTQLAQLLPGGHGGPRGRFGMGPGPRDGRGPDRFDRRDRNDRYDDRRGRNDRYDDRYDRNDRYDDRYDRYDRRDGRR